jgi:hypothetical protein
MSARKRFGCICGVFYALSLAAPPLLGQAPIASNSKIVSKEVLIRGRVLADIAWQAHGSGLGPKYETFIFGWEQIDGSLLPVKIAYAYFGKNGLPASFFNFTRRFELKAVQQKQCEQTVGNLSVIRNIDPSGQELSSSNVLRPLHGVPNDLLKPEMNLSCYIVEEGKFKSLTTPAASAATPTPPP